jgi:transposase
MSEQPTQRLCLDKAYDSQAIKDLVQSVYGYVAHVRSRGEEERELNKKKGERPWRSVVERTHDWRNRFRAVLIRREKKVENLRAVLYLACAYYTRSSSGVRIGSKGSKSADASTRECSSERRSNKYTPSQQSWTERVIW